MILYTFSLSICNDIRVWFPAHRPLELKTMVGKHRPLAFFSLLNGFGKLVSPSVFLLLEQHKRGRRTTISNNIVCMFLLFLF
jgi:hypothetical protein